MTLEAIIAVFPDFRGLAGLRTCVDGGGPPVAAQPARRGHAVRSPRGA